MKPKNLNECYEQFPKPKIRFLRTIAKECSVSLNTTYRWVLGDCKPDQEEKKVIISRLTGIPVEELFKK